MDQFTNNSLEYQDPATKPSALNIKRVIARALRFWYLILLSVAIGVGIAYLVNRYTTRIYPVKASIIIKENDENIGAKFLYNNELINPNRNFYNEIYIMKSYPLLQEVIENLNFSTVIYKEGDIKNTEYYNPSFPIHFTVIKIKPGGKNSFSFEVKDESEFSVRYDGGEEQTRDFGSLRFNDTIQVNGITLIVSKKGPVQSFSGERFLVSFHDPIQLARSYSSKLKVSWAELGASVVNIEVQGAVIQKEIEFLNKFIERYQQYDIEKKTKVSIMAMRFLDEQLEVIGDSLQRYEDQMEIFKRKNVTVKLEAETERLFQKIQALEEQKLQFALRENYYRYILNILNSNSYDGVFTPTSLGIEDPVISQLMNKLIEIKAQIDLYRNTIEKGVDLSQQNPILQSKQQQIAIIKTDIQRAIDNARKTEKINLSFLDDQIRSYDLKLKRLPGTERELLAIQRNYTLRESLYVFLLQKRTEAGLSEASTTSDIVTVNPPTAGGAITPKVFQNYGLGGLLGLVIPILVFVIAELLNDKIQSRDDISQFTTVPLIGGIGHNAEVEPLVVVNKPKSAMAESFRALRSNLSYFTNNKTNQVFMVTSSIPNEGKSFTTINLASVFALAGKRTLIIGADLRKPKLFEELKLSNEKGLSQYLSSMATLDEILQKTSIENLYMISGGAMPPNPSELLMRPTMSQMLMDLKSSFDYIILDTPPLGLVTDAFVLAPMVNHVLFVVRQDYTPRGVLQSLEDYYKVGKLTNISIVFNDLRKSGLGYGYGNYGYHYGYGYNYGYNDY